MFVLSPQGPYFCVNCGAGDNESVYKCYGSQIKHHTRSPSTEHTSLPSKNNSCRLSKCQHCDQLVDEYVQLDYNVLFLDAMLQKHSFYRHILLNCEISHKSAVKVAIFFGLCEAFQRWTELNGATLTHSSSSINLFASKTYEELELSFYFIFLAVIIENAFFNVLLYLIMTCFQKIVGRNGSSFKKSCSFSNMLLSLIMCSYGKLFLIPSHLYAGELKYIIDKLIQLFCIFSLVQCVSVKAHTRLNHWHPYAIVGLALVVHKLLFRLVFSLVLLQCFKVAIAFVSLNVSLLDNYLV